MPYRMQDPQAAPDYSYDWSDFLDEGGSPSDTLATSVWSIEPTNDGSPTEPALSGDTTNVNVTSVFVTGIQRGQVYRLTNTVTTAMGRRDEWSITIRGEQR